MVKKLSKTEATSILGVAGDNTRNGQIRADEFLAELRGKKAINKFREMRDNDSTIGAVMYATEQVLRDVDLKVHPANDTPAAQREADFVQSVLKDMEHSLDDHVADDSRENSHEKVELGHAVHRHGARPRTGRAGRTSKMQLLCQCTYF